VRPTTILSLLTGLLIAIVAVVTAIVLMTDRTRNYLWFFWAAPLLVFVFGLMMLNLLRQYWKSVGKLEVKGRPRAG
jgi:flagellar biosynthesis protein FliQ